MTTETNGVTHSEFEIVASRIYQQEQDPAKTLLSELYKHRKNVRKRLHCLLSLLHHKPRQIFER